MTEELRDEAGGGPAGYDEIVERTRSEAKRRLARELHDSVAQTLTLMVVDMEHFKLDMAGQQTLVSRIDRLQESTREVLRRLRQALYQLREEPVLDAGFVPYLRMLLDGIERGSGVRVRLCVADGWPPALAQPTTHGLRRIVVEALHHVLVQSTAVEVKLETWGGNMVLKVHGNGSPAPWAGRRSQGLVGMRGRVALLGGRLRVSSGEGDWARTVRVSVPRPVG